MKLAVTSCAKLQQINPQPVWSEIRAERPEGLLMLGDNIYLDRDNHNDPAALARELRGLYEAQRAEPNFAALLADLQSRGVPLMAIYDDHDFIGNNRYGGDHDPALAQAAREEFVRAFSPGLSGQDVYCKRTLGNVDVLMLDARYYRRSPKVSGQDPDAVLGVRQWSWLEREIHASTAAFLVVASSTTFHQFGDESWEQYPAAFERLRALIGHRKGALVLSGDVHRNALYDDSGVLEVVTSAVARKGLMFGVARKNYGLLHFGAEALRIELRSLKAHSRFDITIALQDWQLP